MTIRTLWLAPALLALLVAPPVLAHSDCEHIGRVEHVGAKGEVLRINGVRYAVTADTRIHGAERSELQHLRPGDRVNFGPASGNVPMLAALCLLPREPE